MIFPLDLVQKSSHNSRERTVNRLSSGVAQIVPQNRVRAAKGGEEGPGAVRRSDEQL
jgi:hypothetical protein